MKNRISMAKPRLHLASRPVLQRLPCCPWFYLFLGIMALLMTGGCRAVQTTAELPGRAVKTLTPGLKEGVTIDPVELQQTLLRFADEFAFQILTGTESLRRGTNALPATEKLRIKIAFLSEITSIATGPNSFVNLLDMTTFVTATRVTLEEYWQPEVFGPSVQPMLDACRNAETELWQVVDRLLNKKQQTQLHNAIAAWRQKNRTPESMLGIRALKLASDLKGTEKNDASSPGSVFGLLMLDPLAGMDPAVREIAQTRLFAERALYLVQKMPTLLRWQAELLSLNTTGSPTVQQLVTNTTDISRSLERFATVAEKLPAQISAEREEIVKALAEQEKDISALLTNGTQMSDSLNTTLQTFDALMVRFGVGVTNEVSEPTSAGETSSEPFRIQDYTETAAQLEKTARQLTELLATLNQTTSSTNLDRLTDQVGPVMDEAASRGTALVNHIFGRAVILVVVIAVVMLIYRILRARLLPPDRDRPAGRTES